MRRGVRAKSIEVQLQFVVHTQESKSREIVREMSGLASFGQVVPAIVGMMGCSFGVFYCVRNLKVRERKKKKTSSCVRKTKTRPWLSPTTRAHRGGCRAARQVPPPGTPPSRGLHSFRITLRLSSLRTDQSFRFKIFPNCKVLGGQCAGTYADPSWAMKTAQYIQKMPREGADSKVFMNPIAKGHMPKTSTGATW